MNNYIYGILYIHFFFNIYLYLISFHFLKAHLNVINNVIFFNYLKFTLKISIRNPFKVCDVNFHIKVSKQYKCTLHNYSLFLFITYLTNQNISSKKGRTFPLSSFYFLSGKFCTDDFFFC